MNSRKIVFAAIVFFVFALSLGTYRLAAQEKAEQKTESGTAATNAEKERARAVLSAAAQAAGGAALGDVESVELTVRSQIAAVHGTLDTEASYWVAYPDRLRAELWFLQPWLKGHCAPSGSGPVTPMQMEEDRTFVSAEGYDGKAGWMRMPFGFSELPMNEEVKLRIDLIGALGLNRRASGNPLDATYAGEELIEGRKLETILVASRGGFMQLLDYRFEADPDGNRIYSFSFHVPTESVKLYLDPQSHLLAGVRLRGLTDKGALDELLLWSDYRAIKFKAAGKEGSIQFPMTWTVYRDDKKYREEKVKKLKLNTRPNPKLFSSTK